MKNASIDGETLPSKYDINKLELRRDEFRNGTIMKNGSSKYIGGLLHDRPLQLGGDKVLRRETRKVKKSSNQVAAKKLVLGHVEA